MTVKRPANAELDRLSKAIRKYRNEIGLTQAQFAIALGLAPTSIYRYEAGASAPDVGTLQKLYIHSDREGNAEAKRTFHTALSEKVGISLVPENWEFSTVDETNLRGVMKHISIQGRPLTPREQLLVVAFVLMVRNNLDESSEKMMRLLLEPWMKAAKDEFVD